MREYVERYCQRERDFRQRSPQIQEKLREGKDSAGNPQERALREAKCEA